MTKTYECMVLLDNREVKKGWPQLKDAVATCFTKHGAEVLSARLWGERRLAYPIKHRRRGTYLLMYFSSDPQNLAAIRRDLDFSESVLRQMVLACEEVPADAHDPEAEFDTEALADGVEEVVAEEAAEGDTAEGDATEGDAKEGDAKEGDTAEGDTAEGDTAEGDTAEGDATEGDTAEGDATEGDTAEGDAKAADEGEPAAVASEDAGATGEESGEDAKGEDQ